MLTKKIKKPYKPNKPKKEDKPAPRTCQTCEFDSKEMCIIHGEGFKGREANTCNDWGINLRTFIQQDKRKKR